MDFDFLAHQQPNITTVRALWYVHHFQQAETWSHGFFFEKQLRDCQLNDTLGSLKRIDALLDQIRKLKPNRETFFQYPENQNFLLTIAFYAGELRGRLIQATPVWYDWQNFGYEFPQWGKQFPNTPEYEWVAVYRHDDEISTYFPLAAILARLFPENEEPIQSLYASVTFGQWYEDDFRLPEMPTQSLAIDFVAEMAKTSRHQLPYLQMLPPPDVYHHADLTKQIEDLPILYNRGRVVWAALVQGHQQLFKYGNTRSYPAEILYDASGRTSPAMLKQWAQSMAQGESLSGSLKEEMAHMPIKLLNMLIWLPHLPNGILTLPIFPILIADQSPAATLLPALYWQDTQFYRDWLREQAIQNDENRFRLPENYSSQETAAAFAQFLQREPRLWHGYMECVSPQAEQLPHFGAQPIPSTGILYETDQDFVRAIRHSAMSDYRRFEENRPNNAQINDCIEKIRSGDHSHSHETAYLYAQLRLLNNQDLLQELAEDSHFLPPFPPHMWAQLNAMDWAKLLRFLRKNTHNPTALLYLTHLYLTGQFVPQSLYEAADWLKQACGLGDARATYWLAQWLLTVPQLTPIFLAHETHQAAIDAAVSHLRVQASAEEIAEQEHAFLHHQAVQHEMARQKFQLADALGHPNALTHLQQLIQEKRLPEHAAEARFTDIALWLMQHFDVPVFRQPEKTETQQMVEPSKEPMPLSPTLPEKMPPSPPNKRAFSWGILGKLLLILLPILAMCYVLANS